MKKLGIQTKFDIAQLRVNFPYDIVFNSWLRHWYHYADLVQYLSSGLWQCVHEPVHFVKKKYLWTLGSLRSSEIACKT